MATATFQDVRHILQHWDKGSKSEREVMLNDFINQCENMTGPELESHFHDCASLFLARITSWLRITYMFGTCLKLQLQAIAVFISASTSFLMEFLEVGGVLTLLEIISLKSCLETDKSEAQRLLTLVANKGRQYKEMICESYGVKVVAESLAHSQTPEAQECAQNLLHELSVGNPRYQSLIYKTLIKLLTSASPEAQRLATYTLRQIQPSMGVVSASIVDPLLQLLKSLHSEVQHEAGLLIHEILKYEEIHQPLLLGLVTLLKPENVSKTKTNGQPLAAHLQQAGAARIISEITDGESLIGEKLIELNVIHHLLYAVGNSGYPDSQRQALKGLQVFIKKYLEVKELVELLVGDELFQKLKSSPSGISESLSLDDIDTLVGCLGHKD